MLSVTYQGLIFQAIKETWHPLTQQHHWTQCWWKRLHRYSY